MLSLLHLEGGFYTLMVYQLSWLCWLSPQFPSLSSLSISTHFDRTNRTQLLSLLEYNDELLRQVIESDLTRNDNKNRFGM
jgi:hypothetical protein